MKKIVFIIESLGAGGAERQLVGLAIMLHNLGFQVTVLTYYNQNFYEDMLIKEGIEHIIYGKAYNRFLRPFLLSKKVNELDPDLAIAFLPGANVALSFGRFIHFLKCKLIVSERNFTWNWNLLNKLYFNLYKSSDAIVTNSNVEAINIKNNISGLKNKTYFIPNFVDAQNFKPLKHEKNEVLHVLTVARIKEYKNAHGLIEAAKVLNDKGYKLHFSWYGFNYNDQYYEYVKKLIRDYNLEDSFQLLDPVKNINEKYLEADFFCLPSFTEGYPNVIIEAMSCQLPVLCSNICENPYIVEDDKNGFLFNPYKVDDIVNAFIKAFSLSTERYESIGEENRNKVLKNNSKKAFVEGYLNLINTL
ncbi:glycosyltransferase [Segatella baroniae]|nr:glycosyltransferase [Segatella baroniae]